MPANAMNAAGTNAHRCGWSVHRSESTASIAQAAAKASSTEPVMTCSCAPANGPATSAMAPTRPPMREPATMRPM